MGRISMGRPASALGVAILALVVAAAGSAIAQDPGATSSVSKQDKRTFKRIAKKQAKKQGKRQANKQIKKKEPKLNVNSAQTAASATSADSAKTADSATSAESATTADSARPFAYAKLNGPSVAASAPSRNIVSSQVSVPEDGLYCLDLDFTPVAGSATSEAESGSDDFAMIDITPGPLAGCPAGTDAEVRNYDVSVGAQATDIVFVELSK